MNLNKMNQKNLWNNATVAGTALGGISIFYMFIQQLIAQTESLQGIASTIILGLLWMVKLAGCILLMIFFMKRFHESDPDSGNAGSMKFGVATSFCSALIYSAVLLANMLYISESYYMVQFEYARQVYAGMMDANTMHMMEKIMGRMPQIMFFSTLIYCFLYGTVVSAIISRKIPPQDPFGQFNK